MNNYEKAKKILEKSGADYEIMDTGSQSLRLEDQVRSLGVEFKQCTGTLLIKNNEGKYYALLRRDDRKINDKKLSDVIGTKNFKMCNKDELDKLGFDAGLVSPILLRVNTDVSIEVIVDKKVLDLDYTYSGVSKVNKSLKIKVDDLLQIVGDYRVVDYTDPNPDRQPKVEGEKSVVYTADTPTGQLHLGHYVGTVKNRVKLQDKYECFFGLANYHSFSYMKSGKPLYKKPNFIHDSTLEVAMDNLAIGIDPEKSVLYIESDVPETCEAGMLFSMLVKHSRALRNPTIKDEIVMKGMGDKYSLGFINYPMLQAADILLFKAELIPVGEDQLPHIEQSREIARDFNKLYGETFPVPEGLVGDVGNLPGLDNQKMSKSLGNAITFTDSDDEIEKKIMQMYTDPNRIHSTDPGRVEGNPVFIYHDNFNSDEDEVNELKERYRKGKVGDVEVKKKLAEAIKDFIKPIRVRRKKLEENQDRVIEILSEGGKKARTVAKQTIDEMRERMKLTYGTS